MSFRDCLDMNCALVPRSCRFDQTGSGLARIIGILLFLVTKGFSPIFFFLSYFSLERVSYSLRELFGVFGVFLFLFLRHGLTM